jgi:hypothetical protein
VSKEQTAAAIAAVKQYAAERAVDDPAKLARAARIVRVALARQRLAMTDLLPPDDDRAAAA